MEVYDLDKIICNVISSFAMDNIDVPIDVIENIRHFYLKGNTLNEKRRIKSKEILKDDKGRK